MQVLLLFRLVPLVQALEDYVGLLRFLDRDHLDLLALEQDGLGEGLLADLALELGEVVGCGDAVDLLLDLAVDPHLEAVHVDQLTRPLALAGREQHIIRGGLVGQTNLAAASQPLVGRVHPILLPQVVGVPDRVGRIPVATLNHQVLHPAQLDGVARGQRVSLAAVLVQQVLGHQVSVGVDRALLVGRQGRVRTDYRAARLLRRVQGEG